jgi:hypothetical protein
MIKNLILTDESSTQISSDIPIKAIDLFSGLNKEVNLFQNKLKGKSKIYFLSKYYGSISGDKVILPYEIANDSIYGNINKILSF